MTRSEEVVLQFTETDVRRALIDYARKYGNLPDTPMITIRGLDAVELRALSQVKLSCLVGNPAVVPGTPST